MNKVSTGLVILAAWLVACSSGGTSLTDRLILVRSEGIVELSLATGEENLLFANPDESLLIEPAVSPDGRQIAYVRELKPIVLPDQPAEFGHDLYVANADGSGARLVAEHEQQNDQIRAPAWLPDGQRMFVNTQRLLERQFVTAIELLDLATGERVLVLEDASRPAVSGDGRLLAFVREDEDLHQALWIANSDGSDPRVLAGEEDGLASFGVPKFSPDGRFIAFGAAEDAHEVRRPPFVSRWGGGARRAERASYNGSPMDIWIVELKGDGIPRKIADLELDAPSLAWSGDGLRLFVLAGSGLFAVDPEGGSTRVSGQGSFHGQLDWLAPN